MKDIAGTLQAACGFLLVHWRLLGRDHTYAIVCRVPRSSVGGNRAANRSYRMASCFLQRWHRQWRDTRVAQAGQIAAAAKSRQKGRRSEKCASEVCQLTSLSRLLMAETHQSPFESCPLTRPPDGTFNSLTFELYMRMRENSGPTISFSACCVWQALVMKWSYLWCFSICTSL